MAVNPPLGDTMKRVTTVVLITLVLWACSGPGTDVVAVDADAGAEVVDSKVMEVIIKADTIETVDTGLDLGLDWGIEIPVLACDPGEGCFGDQCTENGDCDSGWCVEHMGESVCSQTCQEECPEGWTCTQVAGTVPDVVFVCVSDFPNLCRPCSTALDCAGATGTEDACLAYGEGGSFCGGACDDEIECPWGFSCQEATTVDGVQLQQCVNDTGECPCTDTSMALGLWTPCRHENEFGMCEGQRFCGEEGLTDCDAPMPAAEQCNGLDDDCDGDVDEPDLIDGNFVNLCDDGSICTGEESCAGEDGCQEGTTLVCDDNDVCNGEESCDPALGCQGGQDLDCDDWNDCTSDTCDSETGCLHEDLTGGECLDGNPCTVADHCEQGECVGDPVQCDDENPCTDNVCTETGGCEYPPAPGECDDGDPCTVGDHCAQGACLSTPVQCDCQSDEDCAGLEDGDFCNGTLVCDMEQFPFKCAGDPLTVPVCPEPDGENAFCLQAHCDAPTGECSLVPNHEGFLCDNGDACTVVDKCLEGVCTKGVDISCNDGNPCTDDSCDVGIGCVFQDNTLPCTDNNVCTTGDQCDGGACVGGPALECSDADLCNGLETCDPAVGCLNGEPLLCDDGDFCNGAENCDPAEGCLEGQVPVCDDGNICTDDSCDSGEGCVHVANQAACDDGNACTVDDHCDSGQCIFGGPVECGDDNLCTDDVCDPGLGCLFVMNEAPCDDEDICTLADHCHLGGCIGGVDLVCDDGDSCTDDSCNSGLGCQFVFNDAGCEDGDPCTLDDVCALGVCSGQAKDCGDGNVCTDDACGGDGVCLNPTVEDGLECGNGPEWQCVSGDCQCVPQCEGLECGDDLCGGSCGLCPGPQDDCQAGLCVCLPDCQGKECGDDGCGGTCGQCPLPQYECLDGLCTCSPECEGKQCGDDGCAGSCGECGDCEQCDAGLCEPLTFADLQYVHYGNIGGFAVPSSTDAGPFNAATPHWSVTLGPENPGQGGSTAGATESWIQVTATNMPTFWTLISADEQAADLRPYGGGVFRFSGQFTARKDADVRVGLSDGDKTLIMHVKQDTGTEWIPFVDSLIEVNGATEQARFSSNGGASFSDWGYVGDLSAWHFYAEGEAFSYQDDGYLRLSSFEMAVCGECSPYCGGKECGADGCGGSCGDCPQGQVCTNGQCGSCAQGSTTFDYSGAIVDWSVPACANLITIEVWGAEGGRNTKDNYLGGKGARMRGDFTDLGGASLKILVGGEGEDVLANAGAGGGSFVWADGAGVPLIVAGGGGGGGYDNAGIDAVTSQNGTHGNGQSSGGGVDGQGGTLPDGYQYSGGGAGWYSNGNPGLTSASCSLATPAVRPLEGGDGGIWGGDHDSDGNGGFGGGGAGQGGCTVSGGAGGGGGYSGGGPGGYLAPLIRGGGGGGSYNEGGNQSNSPGVKTGHGQVVISW